MENDGHYSGVSDVCDAPLTHDGNAFYPTIDSVLYIFNDSNFSIQTALIILKVLSRSKSFDSDRIIILFS